MTKQYECIHCGFTTLVASMFFNEGEYAYACPECTADSDSFDDIATVSMVTIDTSDIMLDDAGIVAGIDY